MEWNGRQPPFARAAIRKRGVANTGAGRRQYSQIVVMPPVIENDFLCHDDSDKNALAHYGIFGMKWGVRRYQNEDGTYTEEGKRRYGSDNKNEKDNWKKSDAKNLSDEELNRRTSRLQREQNYENLMTSQKERARKQLSDDIKKKLIAAAIVAPTIAIIGAASKKQLGAASAKAAEFIGQHAKALIRKIKTNNLLKQAAARGENARSYQKRLPEELREYFPRKNGGWGPRTYDFVKREPPLWKRKVIL